ncbi:MAG: hypothetical protein KDA49_01110, partial [Rhodospirillaceae bacterium]|nr:hypothetical protein [Rhodospirillaceae bacterium]
FKAGGSLRGHEIEGLWRLNGSALFLVAFELTTRTEETGRSGVHTAWWVKYYIETLDASVLSLQHAEKGWRHRYVRCKSTAG